MGLVSGEDGFEQQRGSRYKVLSYKYKYNEAVSVLSYRDQIILEWAHTNRSLHSVQLAGALLRCFLPPPPAALPTMVCRGPIRLTPFRWPLSQSRQEWGR